MARKKKPEEGSGDPPWLITFTDMMTLMLTFFVLLVSMSVMDERRKLVVIGSIIGTFGLGEQGFDPRSIQDKRRTVEPGPMEDESLSTDDLEPLKNLMYDDMDKDLNFQSNRFVQIVSISDDVLYSPGETELKPAGKRIIDRMLPFLLQVKYPLLLAGHTTIVRDEMVADYKVTMDEEELDPSWRLSMQRVLGVYRYLLERGMAPNMLRVEAFGKYHPMYPETTATGRRANRRVDIVLDKRNSRWIERLEANREAAKARRSRFSFKDFDFSLGNRGEEARPGE
ncbi:MAG: flagellar motor protein MotB [Desulfovibrionaceae bacterium]